MTLDAWTKLWRRPVVNPADEGELPDEPTTRDQLWAQNRPEPEPDQPYDDAMEQAPRPGADLWVPRPVDTL